MKQFFNKIKTLNETVIVCIVVLMVVGFFLFTKNNDTGLSNTAIISETASLSPMVSLPPTPTPTPSPTETPEEYKDAIKYHRRIGGNFEIIELKNGINSIDLNGDGIKDMILKTRRENGTSPHWQSVYSFSIFSESIQFAKYYQDHPDKRTDKDNPPYWHTVLIWSYRKNSDYELNWKTISTSEGADGFLQDIRLIKYPNRNPILVLAVRDFGESYAGLENVSFHFYYLEENAEGEWDSEYFYDYRDTAVADNKYVDVQEAFFQELAKKY